MNTVNRTVPALLAHCFKLVAILVAGLIAYQSLAPTSAPGSLNHLDKFLHAAAYCGLTFFIAGGWHRSSLLFVFLTAAALGAALEIGQGLMGLGRTASFADQMANMVGAGLACCVWVVIVKLYRRRRILP